MFFSRAQVHAYKSSKKEQKNERNTTHGSERGERAKEMQLLVRCSGQAQYSSLRQPYEHMQVATEGAAVQRRGNQKRERYQHLAFFFVSHRLTRLCTQSGGLKDVHVSDSAEQRQFCRRSLPHRCVVLSSPLMCIVLL